MLAVLLALLLGPQAATPPGGEDPPPARPGTVVRVSVGLVQVDAVVTDKQGHQVTALTAADFVIKEGGQEREITQLSYLRLSPPPATGGAASVTSAAAGTAPGPPGPH